MRIWLHVRIAAIGVAVMALTLIIVAVLTHQQIENGDRNELDNLLKQEMSEVRLTLPKELESAAGADNVLSAIEIDVAVQRYLAVHPGNARQFTTVEIDNQQFSTRDGPAEVKTLRQKGALPVGRPGSIETVDSAAGPLRVLTAPLMMNSKSAGNISVVGTLVDGRQQADDAFIRILLAGFVGLVLGGLVLLFAVRRALQPVRALANAARSVDLSDLESRVPNPPRSDEVGLMAREFNRMLARISRSEHQRQQLLSAVSHELRTPLAVAHGHLELFETLGPSDGETAAGTAAVVRRELDRLSRIVDDLTAVSTGGLGGATSSEPVFAPDVLAALTVRLDGLGFDDVVLESAPEVVLLGDEDRLTQALLNLVVNARIHTPDGTQVRVGARLQGSDLAFYVADNGPGIEADRVSTVFEPFVTTRPDGPNRTSGLGLSVVKAVTEAQGGRIDLQSGESGTTVSLIFPLDD